VRVHEGLEITWLGHAMFRLRTPGGKIVFLDPFVDGNPAFPASGRGLLDRADLILVTHAHGDHSGGAVSLAKATQAPVVGVYELASYLGRHGIETVGMNKGTEVTLAGLGVVMTHAEHSSGFVEDGGRVVEGGEPVGYVLRLEDGFRLYFAGDTAVFGDMALIRELWAPQLALLPIGGHFTMGPREAAHACRLLGVQQVIPMHFGTFPPLVGRPAELAQALEGSGVQMVELTPGQSTEP
jgi:L-ascorbate metabolism protein UlaG (beta-lactamase superfamily)